MTRSELESVPPLFGLVLAGGKSTRMKIDKSLLHYHGKSQVEHAFDLLTGFCPKVFVSNRAEQSQLQGHQDRPQLHDLPEFSGIGPLGGILSALTTHPKTAWLILACDLPYVTSTTLQFLIKNRNPKTWATAFKSTYDALPEPLCAIWEPGCLDAVTRSFKSGLHCPRKTLINMGDHATFIDQQDKHWLDNVNTPEEYKSALKALKHHD